MKYGTKNDVNIWFSAWIKLCCRDGHFERVLWVIGKLIDNHRDIGLRSTAEIEDLASWLETIAEPLDIIRNIILPELAQICSNTKTDDGSDESKQSKSAKELLLKIHKSLELFT